MFEWVKGYQQIEWQSLVLISGAERPAQLHPRPFEEAGIGIGKESLESFINCSIAKVESRLQVEEDLLVDVLGQMNRKHD
jgi:hypothetical protein